MNIKDIPMFTFAKVDGQWVSKVNPAFLFHFETVEGVPRETVADWIQDLSKPDRLALMMASWRKYVRENDVSDEELDLNRAVATAEKDEVMKDLAAIFS